MGILDDFPDPRGNDHLQYLASVTVLYLSFTEWGAFGFYEWGGTVNFERMLGDSVLWQSLRNTLVFTVGSVPFGIALSIIVAVLLNTKIRECPLTARCISCL